MNLSPGFLDRVKQEEGFAAESFWDDAPGGGGGQWTWGYGTRAPGGPGLKITRQAATMELIAELEEAVRDYGVVFQSAPPGLTQARYDSLVDMVYNLGLSRFAEFHQTIGAIRDGDWIRAALHATQSLWYRQVGDRAKRVVEELRTGYSAVEPPATVPVPPLPVPPARTDGLLDRIAKMFMLFIAIFRR